jgi:hypothetical protein
VANYLSHLGAVFAIARPAWGYPLDQSAMKDAFVVTNRLGVSSKIGVYQSDPSIHFRGSQTEIHYGAFRYSIVGAPPAEMSGHYWTDRNTNGSIQFKKRS